MTESRTWEQHEFNRTLDRGGFHLSFNPDCSANPVLVVIDRLLTGEEQGAETAIVTDGSFFILVGDHCLTLAECPTLQSCMDYFLSNIGQMAPNSDMPEADSEGVKIAPLRLEP